MISFHSDQNTQNGKDYVCGDDKFKCKNNKCILLSRKCDRYNDCGDNSDEDNDCEGKLYNLDIVGNPKNWNRLLIMLY